MSNKKSHLIYKMFIINSFIINFYYIISIIFPVYFRIVQNLKYSVYQCSIEI